MASIIDFLEKKLYSFKSTFKQTSVDKANKQYLCRDISKQVYNFDRYSKSLDKTQQKASPDAIFIDNNKIYCVEFKNAPLKNIRDKGIKNKFKSGTILLQELLRSFNLSSIDFIFCIVYNGEKSKYFTPRFKNFGLDDINIELDNFYNDIITKDVNFYKNNFKELKCS